MDLPGPSNTHCYCNANTIEVHMIPCVVCKKLFHRECLKTGPPSTLAGDVYFKLTCVVCAQDGKEIVQRIKLQWLLVVILALYNLQLQSSGKCGFYRWREDICRFIDQNWCLMFGADKKRAATWHHTVAGVLSNNNSHYFISGSDVLGEKGWWTLRERKLPTIDELDAITNNSKSSRKCRAAAVPETPLILEGTRQRRQNVLEAALELKAKRTSILDYDIARKAKKRKVKEEDLQVKITLSKDTSDMETNSDTFPHQLDDSGMFLIPRVPKKEPVYDWNEPVASTSAACFIKQEPGTEISIEKELTAVAEWLEEHETCPDEVNIPFVQVTSMPSTSKAGLSNGSLSGKNSTPAIPSCSYVVNNTSVSTLTAQKGLLQTQRKKVFENQHLDTSRKRKVVVREEEKPVENTTVSEPKLVPMSAYEEEQLLVKLESLQPLEDVRARNLYRKLVVRKRKRERNIPIFDLDECARRVLGIEEPVELSHAATCRNFGRQEILDRYQIPNYSVSSSSNHYIPFCSRLIGLEEHELQSIVSPHTTRVLKPFIFRDEKMMPLKAKLLRDIVAHAHRGDPSWSPPRYPIDFCYVRPQHIPAVNSLCHEFFWPGIDLSESLQYPDFSCVVLYRKLIIGFAFMVPDVKFNEAYISFIFCHPEWRRCGIATVMLYHLVQTCMGKDITLHVSANNSALCLYHKFGFRTEEIIRNFYDKYLPISSRECRDALFMRWKWPKNSTL